MRGGGDPRASSRRGFTEILNEIAEYVREVAGDREEAEVDVNRMAVDLGISPHSIKYVYLPSLPYVLSRYGLRCERRGNVVVVVRSGDGRGEADRGA